MKKFFLILFAVLIIGGITGYLVMNEKLPEGDRFEEADARARLMLEAVNDSAWQETGIVSWNFMGVHEHLWDRERHLARVKWKDNEVYIDINARSGVAFQAAERVEGKQADKLVDKAWKFWVNDAFWLNPVSKVFDDGTQRSLVTLKDGKEGLRVSYTSGGNTPGDTYVWILDENYLPVCWKMWVSIIPIGGIEVPWNGWVTTETGAKICTLHDAAIDLELKDVRTANHWSEWTGETDPFKVLLQQ